MRRYWLLARQPKVMLMITGLVVAMMTGAVAGVMTISANVAAESARAAVHETTITVEERIPFQVEEMKSYVHPTEFRETKQAGVEGVKQFTYKVRVRGDGVEIGREKLEEKVSAKPVGQVDLVGARLPNALTKAKSAQIFTDSKGVTHRETYYDLPMNVVMGACGAGGVYTVREDGAKIDKDVYVIVAANYGNYPRCSVVETSMGPGKVYDTGGFAAVHPHGFDLATDWTNGDGR